ncbi:hypothetical protein F8M41_013956 [Gigaspora margarita]|uniref:Uncharacterized protein n=1 Tax=Gigaspora margarita TaxID=4874 RepID=A0A8H3WZ56_GIGMA|nr:hypothetical protein F8M41_013956 [Gigaspora margarita]
MILKIFNVPKDEAMIFLDHCFHKSIQAYSSPTDDHYLSSKLLLISYMVQNRDLKTYYSFLDNSYIDYKSDKNEELDAIAKDLSLLNLIHKSLKAISKPLISVRKAQVQILNQLSQVKKTQAQEAFDQNQPSQVEKVWAQNQALKNNYNKQAIKYYEDEQVQELITKEQMVLQPITK